MATAGEEKAGGSTLALKCFSVAVGEREKSLQRWTLSIPSLLVHACHSTLQEAQSITLSFNLTSLEPCHVQENVEKVTLCHANPKPTLQKA